MVFKSTNIFMRIEVTIVCGAAHIQAQERIKKAKLSFRADFEVLFKQEVNAKKEL